MEGIFAEKSYSTKILPPPPPPPSNYEQIDLTLKLSPCGQGSDEEKWLTRLSSISDEKSKSTMNNNVCTEEDKWSSLPVSVEGERRLMRFGDLQTMRRVRTGKRLLLEKQRRRRAAEEAAAAAAAAEAHKSILNTLPNSNSSSCSWNQGGASSNIQMTLSPSPTDTTPAKKLKHVDPFLSKGDAMNNNVLRQMPGVTTTGDGPKGKRIEGLLYKYKGGQACILCACHGSFLSPAQFVMHAGGKEVVADPMKHITICSNSFYIQGDDGSASAFNS